MTHPTFASEPNGDLEFSSLETLDDSRGDKAQHRHCNGVGEGPNGRKRPYHDERTILVPSRQ